MKITTTSASLALLAAAALTVTGCAANEGPATTAEGTSQVAASDLTGTLIGKGASSQSVAQQTWIAGFQTANPGVTINYSPDGSGAGREGFREGAVAFAGSDRAFDSEEMAAGGFGSCAADSSAYNLPVYISPIALIFNVDGVEELNLTPDTVAKIFSGKITTWNDPAIAATNEGADLPEAAITAVHRSDDSGTTENFTDYLAEMAADVWTEEPDGEWPTAFGGEAAKGTSGVVDAVAKGKNTIGYADASQAGDLGVVAVKSGDGFTGPTAEAVATLVDASPKVSGRADHDWALELDRTAAGAYPIALVSYVIVCETYADAAEAELVKAYVGYLVSAEGQQAASVTAGNAPLSSTMSANAQAALDAVS